MFAPTDAQTAAAAMHQWVHTAFDEIDYIRAWRDNCGDLVWRGWPDPPTSDQLPTHEVLTWLIQKCPSVDPSPVQDVDLAIYTWYEDHDAERLPDQGKLELAFERARRLLLAVWWATRCPLETQPLAQEAEVTVTAERLAEAQDRYDKAMTLLDGEIDLQILAVAGGRRRSAEDRVILIWELDRRTPGWPASRWAQLLGVTGQAIRKTAFWKKRRAR